MLDSKIERDEEIILICHPDSEFYFVREISGSETFEYFGLENL
jgi:hypothetical protein